MVVKEGMVNEYRLIYNKALGTRASVYISCAEKLADELEDFMKWHDSKNFDYFNNPFV